MVTVTLMVMDMLMVTVMLMFTVMLMVTVTLMFTVRLTVMLIGTSTVMASRKGKVDSRNSDTSRDSFRDGVGVRPRYQ